MGSNPLCAIVVVPAMVQSCYLHTLLPFPNVFKKMEGFRIVFVAFLDGRILDRPEEMKLFWSRAEFEEVSQY